jgi:alkylhydroperoxidase family enzyme
MGTRALRLSLCLTAASAAIAVAAAQTTLDAPGVRQPPQLKAPRIAPLPEAQWTDVHRQLVEKFAGGKPDTAFATLLNLPSAVEGMMPYTNYLANESSLAPRHREILILRTAWLLGNQPLWAKHAPRARQAGLGAADLRGIAQGPDAPGWRPFDVTLLRAVDQLYRNSSITDATWKALAAEYDMFHLMDAVETVNQFTIMAMAYNSFGVQPDPGTTDRLPTDVTYRVTVPPREPPLTVARVNEPAGRGIAVSRTFGQYPRLVQPWSTRQGFIQRVSKLSPRHREMLILRIGWNCRSEYEWAQHVGAVGRARDYGIDPVKVAEGAAASGWDAFEKVLLQVPDELYRDGIVSDATWRALAQQYDTSLMMTAVFTPSAYRAISMSLNSYGIQIEPTTPERFPNVPGR